MCKQVSSCPPLAVDSKGPGGHAGSSMDLLWVVGGCEQGSGQGFGCRADEVRLPRSQNASHSQAVTEGQRRVAGGRSNKTSDEGVHPNSRKILVNKHSLLRRAHLRFSL